MQLKTHKQHSKIGENNPRILLLCIYLKEMKMFVHTAPEY